MRNWSIIHDSIAMYASPKKLKNVHCAPFACQDLINMSKSNISDFETLMFDPETYINLSTISQRL
jgi:hypothetical protein